MRTSRATQALTVTSRNDFPDTRVSSTICQGCPSGQSALRRMPEELRRFCIFVGFLGAGYLIAMLIPIDDGLIYSGLRTPIDFAFNWFNLIPTIGYLVFSSFWIFGKFSPKWMALHLLYLPVIILWTHLISVDGPAGM